MRFTLGLLSLVLLTACHPGGSSSQSAAKTPTYSKTLGEHSKLMLFEARPFANQDDCVNAAGEMHDPVGNVASDAINYCIAHYKN